MVVYGLVKLCCADVTMIDSGIVLLLQLSGIVFVNCQYAGHEDQNADNAAECGEHVMHLTLYVQHKTFQVIITKFLNEYIVSNFQQH